MGSAAADAAARAEPALAKYGVAGVVAEAETPAAAAGDYITAVPPAAREGWYAGADAAATCTAATAFTYCLC